MALNFSLNQKLCYTYGPAAFEKKAPSSFSFYEDEKQSLNKKRNKLIVDGLSEGFGFFISLE